MLDQLAKHLKVLEDYKRQTIVVINKTQAKIIKETFPDGVPNGTNNIVLEDAGLTIKIVGGENYKLSDEVSTLNGELKLFDKLVRTKVELVKKTYDMLDDEEKVKLAPYLTVTPKKPTITIN